MRSAAANGNVNNVNSGEVHLCVSSKRAGKGRSQGSFRLVLQQMTGDRDG